MSGWKRSSEGTRVVGYHRIECPELSIDNDTEKDDSVIIAPGPGTVRIWQPASKDERQQPSGAPTSKAASSGGRGATQTPPSKAKDEGEPELIVITYQNRMYVNNKQDIAKFFDKVALIKVPSNDPYLQLNENHLPLGSLYLTCERLEVLKNKFPDGKTYQEMRRFGKVAIEAQEFSGSADVVKYDESKEQVILEGSPGNDAVLVKQKVHGGEYETVHATKIFYWRSDGTYSVENGRELRVTQ